MFSKFIYPRTVTVTRPIPTSGVGALPYQGLLPVNETVIFSNIAASIQSRGSTSQKAGIPGDSKAAPVWIIIIPASEALNGMILDRDVITDDTNIRYQVSAAYWNSLGYQCECERLQT